MNEQIVRITRESRIKSRIQRLFLEAFPVSERVSIAPFIQSEEDSAALYALMEEGRPLGFVCYLRKSRIVYIFYIAVGRAARGKGIGSRLMRFVTDKYPEDRFFLNCESIYEGCLDSEGRRKRIGFYERLGFSIQGKPHFWRGELFETMTLRGEVSEAEIEDFWVSFNPLWVKEDRN